MIDLCGQGFQVTGLSISKKKKKKGLYWKLLENLHSVMCLCETIVTENVSLHDVLKIKITLFILAELFYLHKK